VVGYSHAATARCSSSLSLSSFPPSLIRARIIAPGRDPARISRGRRGGACNGNPGAIRYRFNYPGFLSSAESARNNNAAQDKHTISARPLARSRENARLGGRHRDGR